MLRLTTKQFLHTHERLRELWLKDSAVFAEVCPTEQWQLHAYFQPAKDWTDMQLLQHREAITQARPSLPQQAGRALSQLWDKAPAVALQRIRRAKAPVAAAKHVPQQDRRLVVKAVVRPEIDVQKLARAFIHLAQDLERRRREEHQGEEQDRSRP